MGSFVFLPLITLGWMPMFFMVLAVASAIILVFVAAFMWLYRKCCPRKTVLLNPDVIPRVPAPRSLLGG